METDYILGPDGGLYHSGIKGMRWGVRRYQNPDGSLTPAGKKRYNKEMERLKSREKKIKGQEKAKARQAKIDAKKAELDEREKALKGGSESSKVKTKTPESTKKGVKDMSDEELRTETSRIMAEAQYLNAQRQLAAMNPKQVSKGEKFAKGLMDAAVPKITNALGDTAASYVKKKVSESLGLDKKEVESAYDVAKREAEYWKNLNTAKQQKDQYQRNVANDKSDAKKAKQDTKEAERERKVEEDIERRMNDIDKKNAKEKAKREKATESEVIDNRKNASSESNSAKKDPIIIDMDDYVNSDSVTSLVPYGRSYVQYLLEDGDR